MTLPRPESGSPTVRRWVLGVTVFFVFAAGLTFAHKYYQFFQDLVDEAGIHFAGPHLMSYTLVVLGFLFLLVLAFLKGHFSDIERPKYEMLDLEIDHDRRLPVPGGRSQ